VLKVSAEIRAWWTESLDLYTVCIRVLVETYLLRSLHILSDGPVNPACFFFSRRYKFLVLGDSENYDLFVTAVSKIVFLWEVDVTGSGSCSWWALVSAALKIQVLVPRSLLVAYSNVQRNFVSIFEGHVVILDILFDVFKAGTFFCLPTNSVEHSHP
jgi:hypothetical protein